MGLCKTGVKPKSALFKLLHGHKYALSLYGLLHIVNAQNVCPFFERNGVQYRCAVQRGLRRAAQQFVYHRFARNAHQHRAVQFVKILKVRHQVVIMFNRFAKAKARVHDDILCAHLVQAVNAFCKVEHHFAAHVFVMREPTAWFRAYPACASECRELPILPPCETFVGPSCRPQCR